MTLLQSTPSRFRSRLPSTPPRTVHLLDLEDLRIPVIAIALVRALSSGLRWKADFSAFLHASPILSEVA